MDADIARLTIDIAAFYLLPVFTFAGIYIYYKEKPGFLETFGLSAKEIGLLLVGSIIGGVVMGDVPVILWANSLLAINIGGALIPIVLSVYLVRKRLLTDTGAATVWYMIVTIFAALFALYLFSPAFLRYTVEITFGETILAIPYLLIVACLVMNVIVTVALFSMPHVKNLAFPMVALLATIQFVSFVTWYVTFMMPGLGIASEFPWYLLPGVCSAVAAMLLFWKDMSKAVPLAYVSASLGTLIGADISRVPLLFRDWGGFVGSIGGAGPLDMVFLSGLIALILSFIFASALAPKELRQRQREKPLLKKSEEEQAGFLSAAENAMQAGQYAESTRLSFRAVDAAALSAEVQLPQPHSHDAYLAIQRLGIHPYKAYDYKILRETASQAEVSPEDAQRALRTSKLMVEEIDRAISSNLGSVTSRLFAFLIDIGIILSIVLPIGLALYINTTGRSSLGGLSVSTAVLAILMWLWISQVFYFTFCEWLWGRTVGKRIIGITVVSEERGKAGFIHAFTRNVVRLIDVSVLVLVSVLMIGLTRKRQRLGDIIAKTIVIRTRGV